MCFNVIHDINESYSIIDNNYFYNDGISKDLNLARDFRMYIRNERIKKKKKKEENKNSEKKLDINKKIQEEKEKNKIELDDDEDPDEEEEEENEKSN
jgi:hypothetical protein